MPELPVASGKSVLAMLLANGWTLLRVNGSHHYVHKVGTAPFPVPVHRNEDLAPKTMNSIIKASGISREEFINLLSE